MAEQRSSLPTDRRAASSHAPSSSAPPERRDHGQPVREQAPAIRAWAHRANVELCFTPTSASWASPIGVQSGPLRFPGTRQPLTRIFALTRKDIDGASFAASAVSLGLLKLLPRKMPERASLPARPGKRLVRAHHPAKVLDQLDRACALYLRDSRLPRTGARESLQKSFGGLRLGSALGVICRRNSIWRVHRAQSEAETCDLRICADPYHPGTQAAQGVAELAARGEADGSGVPVPVTGPRIAVRFGPALAWRRRTARSRRAAGGDCR
jgi:hypothetical protein